MKSMRNHLKLLVLCLLALVGCGGDGGDGSDVPDYSGEWDAIYNIVTTEEVEPCYFFLAPGVPGFTDLQVIEQQGQAARLQSTVGLVDAEGSVDETGTLVVRQTVSETYEGGIVCEFHSSVIYQNLEEGRAETLFEQLISCNDGFVCEDRGFGTSTRRPG